MRCTGSIVEFLAYMDVTQLARPTVTRPAQERRDDPRIARVLEAQERMNARAALSLEQPTVKAALRAFNPLPALETKAS